jgi:hypothetical protein
VEKILIKHGNTSLRRSRNSLAASDRVPDRSTENTHRRLMAPRADSDEDLPGTGRSLTPLKVISSHKKNIVSPQPSPVRAPRRDSCSSSASYSYSYSYSGSDDSSPDQERIVKQQEGPGVTKTKQAQMPRPKKASAIPQGSTKKCASPATVAKFAEPPHPKHTDVVNVKVRSWPPAPVGSPRSMGQVVAPKLYLQKKEQNLEKPIAAPSRDAALKYLPYELPKSETEPPAPDSKVLPRVQETASQTAVMPPAPRKVKSSCFC